MFACNTALEDIMKKIYHLVTLPVFALTLLLMVQCDSSQQPNGLDLLLDENSGVDTSKPDIDEDVQKKVSESEGEGTNEETDITIIVTPGLQPAPSPPNSLWPSILLAVKR